MAPRGWRTVALDDCVAPDAPICYGILMPGEHVPGGVPVVKVRDVERGIVQVDRLLRTAESIDAKYGRSRLNGGDLLLSIRGSVGAVSVVPPVLAGANITQDTARIRLNERVEPRFVVHVLRSPHVQKFLRFHTVGQAVRGVNIRDVRRIPISLPPFEEQVRLADQLDRWENVVRMTSALIALKIRRKRGLLQQLLTGRRRFVAVRDKEAWRKTRLGPIPADWSYSPLGDIAEEVVERAGPNTTAEVLSCSKRDGLVDSLRYFGKRVFSNDRANYKVVRHKQFAFPANHIEEGSIGLLQHRDVGVVSPIYVVFEVDDSVLPEYLYCLFKTNMYRHIFATSTNASVDRRGSLRWKDFARLHVPIPPAEEQHRIVALVGAMDREIALLRRSRDLLESQRVALTGRVLSGEVSASSLRAEAALS